MNELGAEGGTGGRSFETDIMACTGLAASRGLMLKINKARIPTLRMLEIESLTPRHVLHHEERTCNALLCILHEKIMTFIEQNRHKKKY